MLFNRNLLYTAVTRAKKCVTIVGSRMMVDQMNLQYQREEEIFQPVPADQELEVADAGMLS